MKQSLMALAAATLALPLTASPLFAAQSASVQYEDLDLATPAGKAELDRRIRKAEVSACRDSSKSGTLLLQEICQSQVRKFVQAEIAKREQRTGKGG